MAEKTYTYDLSSTVGKIRLLCGDNNRKDPFLWDEEITAISSIAGGVTDQTVAECLMVMATRAALRSEKITLNGGSVVLDPSEAARMLKDLAKERFSKASTTPYSATQDLEDETLELRDAVKGKYEEDYADAPE